MLFTEAGLEQATRLKVAALHAGRFARAGVEHVADLGCGIGGDALALAAIDLEVTAADADEVTAAIAAFNLTPFPEVRVLHARAEDVSARRHRRRLARSGPPHHGRGHDRVGSRMPRTTPRASTSPSGWPTACPSA